MGYGMPPPLPPPHLQHGGDSAGPAPYGSHHSMGHYGASQMSSNFYGNQGFYGNPPSQHPSDVSVHQQGYYPHHPSHQQQQQQMDTNGQLYNAHQMNHPDMMSTQYQSHHPSTAVNQQQDYNSMQNAAMRSKRKQVKNACINCQKACKKCDEGRPCGRCVKYGLVDTCQDSARKERRRGIKRGPYKRRATTGSQPAPGSLTVSTIPGYDRDGHISPTSRSDGMISTPGAESSFSSPAFGSQALTSRPPMPLQMPSNQWQNGPSQMIDDRENMRSRYGQPAGPASYYGYEQDAAHHGYDRSSSAPVNQQGSMLSPIGRFPPSGTPQSQSSQLPSLMSSGSYMGAGVYGNGMSGRMGPNNGSSASLVSPPLPSPATGSSFLSGSTAPNGIAHHRLQSDSSLATLSTTGASSSTMSPRTPLNGPGSEQPMLSPSGSKMMGGFTPPQPTVQPASGNFLQQDPSRPFPLKMPKAPTRGRSGTDNSYVDQHYGTKNLPPIYNRDDEQFARSNPYPNIQADERRPQFASPGMMAKNEKDVAALPPAPAGSLGMA